MEEKTKYYVVISVVTDNETGYQFRDKIVVPALSAEDAKKKYVLISTSGKNNHNITQYCTEISYEAYCKACRDQVFNPELFYKETDSKRFAHRRKRIPKKPSLPDKTVDTTISQNEEGDD